MEDPKQVPLSDGVTWSIGSALGIGIAAFLLPQFIIGSVLVAVAQAQGKDLDQLLNDDSIFLTFILTASVAAMATSILYVFLRGKNVWKRLGLVKTTRENMGLVFPAYAAYFLLTLAVNIALVYALPELAEQEQETGFTSATGNELVFAFVSFVLLAPFYEELLFRGFVFRGIAKATSFWPAAITTSALFGLAHGQLNVALDTFLVGMVASWLVWRTKSLWPAILLHVIKNAVAYLFIFILEVDL